MSDVPPEPVAPAPQAPTPLLKRMLRAALLHADTYEEVEADHTSLGQATGIVFAACLAAAIGFWMRLQVGHAVLLDASPVTFQLLIVAVEPLVVWLGGAALSFMIGATFFRGPETETDYAEILRTTGFAFTPALFVAFSFVPPEGLGLTILVVARLWALVATIVAVRQALDFTTIRAIGTFGGAVILLWLLLWGLSVAPLPIA
jgi:hypothetical protein